MEKKRILKKSPCLHKTSNISVLAKVLCVWFLKDATHISIYINKYICNIHLRADRDHRFIMIFQYINIYINKYICNIHLMEDRDHRFIIFEYTNIYVTYISARIGIICLLFLNISISILHKSQQGSYHSFMIFQYINMYDTFDSRTIGIIGLLYFNISI